MKTLYLHIGTPKTATSSLQFFLDCNKDLLRSLNFSYQVSPVHYPSKNIRRNAFFLNGPYKNAVLTDEEESKYQERLSIGLSFLHEQFSSFDNVIATDEHLWFSFFYSRWDPLQIILNDAAKNDYQVKVLVYLRRQDGYLTSNWNQLVKKGTLQRTFDEQLERIRNVNPLLVCYDQALDKIASGIGKENLIVRRFQSDSFAGGSIFTDFLDALGLDASLPFEIPAQKRNPSLPLNFAELKREMNGNRFLGDEDRERISAALKKTAMNSEDDHSLCMLSTEETRKLLDGFAKGNAVVAEKYIGDKKPLFNDEISKVEKWQSDNAFMPEDFRRFLSELSEKDRWIYLSSLALEQQKDLQELKEKTAELEKENSAQEYTLRIIRALRHPIRTLFKKE